MQERFFILTPTPTTETVPHPIDGKTLPVYHDAEGKPMMWSGDFPIPPVGSRVFVRMNRIGWAVVKGYFESCGFVGLMTLPLNPPEWLIKQRKRDQKETQPKWAKEGIGCTFGNECSLEEPVRQLATAGV